VSFADLEKKISGDPAIAPTASIVPDREPRQRYALRVPQTTLQRWLQRVDPWLLLTALFILVATWPTSLVPDSVHDYGRQWIETTLICELYLFYIGFGAMIAWNKNIWLRVPMVALTVALYVFAVTHDRQFSVAPQAIWLLAVRFLPPRGVAPLSRENIRRLHSTIFGGLAVLIIQFLLLMLLSALLVPLGIGSKVGNTITMPQWFYALLWTSYYVELAFVLPSIAEYDRTHPD
jgi:hypothetical protein